MKTMLYNVCTRMLILFLLARTAQALGLSECGELLVSEDCIEILDETSNGCSGKYSDIGEEQICFRASKEDASITSPINMSRTFFDANYEEVI